MKSVCRHTCLQDSLGFLRRRVGHLRLRYPEQSDLDCLAAFGCSALKVESRRAWELSRLAVRPPRSGFQALTTSSPAYPSGDEGQQVLEHLRGEATPLRPLPVLPDGAMATIPVPVWQRTQAVDKPVLLAGRVSLGRRYVGGELSSGPGVLALHGC